MDKSSKLNIHTQTPWSVLLLYLYNHFCGLVRVYFVNRTQELRLLTVPYSFAYISEHKKNVQFVSVIFWALYLKLLFRFYCNFYTLAVWLTWEEVVPDFVR